LSKGPSLGFNPPLGDDTRSPAQNASRNADASGELSEGQHWQEEFRVKEADRANALFDLPMDPGGDTPRFDEPPLDRFSAEIPDDLHANLQDGEGEQIGQAFIAAGLGNTTAASFVKMGVEA
jgi:hypothetical protein